jgi:glucose/arabinose dehydrogenase
MHLRQATLLLGIALLAGPSLAQQAPAQQQAPQAAPQTTPQTPQVTDPRATADPENQPIKPPANAQPQKPRSSTAAPRNQTMSFTLPDLVPISEIPRGRAVMLQGVVLSPQATTFVLNDGNSSQVINLGPSWRDLTKVKAGDRVRVIGQMDPYGTPVFRAGSILLENNRVIVVPPGG